MLPPLQRDLFRHQRPPAPRPLPQPAISGAQRCGRALRRRGWVLAASLAASALGAGMALAAIRPMYQSSARLEAQAPPPLPVGLGAAASAPAVAAGVPLSRLLEIQTMAAELGSRPLIATVVQRLGAPLRAGLESGFWRARRRPLRSPQALATAALRQLEIAADPQSQTIELRFTAPQPQLAADFLRQLLAAYLEQTQTRQRAAADQRVAYLAAQAAAARQQVAADQRQLAASPARASQPSPPAQLALASQRAQELEAAATAAQVAALQQANAPSLSPGFAASPASSSATPPVELSAKRAELAADIARLAAQYRPSAAPLRQATQELAGLDAALAALARQQQRQQQRTLAGQRAQAADLQQALQAQLGAQSRLEGTMGGYELAQRRLQADQNAYSSLLEQTWQAAVAAAAPLPPPLRTLDPPEAPLRPLRPQAPVVAAYALLLACGLGAAAVWALEALEDGIRMPEAAELGVPLLALLPPLPPRAATQAGARLFARGIEDCAAALLLAHAASEASVVHLASPGGGEGTTTVARRLAQQLAEVSGAVLLLDGNPYASALAAADAAPGAPGLIELLAGRAPIEQVVRRLGGRNEARQPGADADGELWYIPRGLASDGDAVSLAAPALAELLAAARRRYDWIVIDGGPLLAGPEPGLWASLADCNLLIARRGRTRRRDLRRSFEVLGASSAAPVGLILNAAPEARTTTLPAAWLAPPPAPEAGAAPLRQRA